MLNYSENFYMMIIISTNPVYYYFQCYLLYNYLLSTIFQQRLLLSHHLKLMMDLSTSFSLKMRMKSLTDRYIKDKTFNSSDN